MAVYQNIANMATFTLTTAGTVAREKNIQNISNCIKFNLPTHIKTTKHYKISLSG